MKTAVAHASAPGLVELFDEAFSPLKLQRYRTLERLGEGTFGEVRKAVDTRNGRFVAIKFVRLLSRKGGLPKAVFREMESLKQLAQCEHIVQLFDVCADESSVCLVMEYIESDLAEVITNTKHRLPRSHLKAYYDMILRSLEHCHSRRIIHRDVKPANLLLTSGGVVKLGDFGLARIYDAQSGEQLSHQVATRQYRAPELLFASRSYCPAVDVWSAAVVMAELATLQPLFAGNNDIDQMYRVFQVMGSPSPDAWPGVEALPDYSKVSFPNMAPVPLQTVLPGAHPEDVAFLASMLVLDPARRLTAQAALQLPYFTQQAPLPVPAAMLQVPLRSRGASGAQRGKPVASVEAFVCAVDAIVPDGLI